MADDGAAPEPEDDPVMPEPLFTVMAGTGVPGYLTPAAALVVAAAAVGYLSVRVKVVPIVGFLLAGVVIGPNQLGLVASTGAVDAAAEVGVILLLFTIGIEFSLERLARVWRWVAFGGGGQVLLAVLVTTGLVALAGRDWRTAVFTGFLVALSSTAIVLTILADRRQTNTLRGRLSLSVLVLQDLAVVAMVVVVPLLGADADGGTGPIVRAVLTAVGVVAVVLVFARRLMPILLGRVAALCSPEVFLLAVVAICFGTAYLTALAGVSVSLGAFLAGLVVSESRHSTQALAEILPLKIIFSAVFFVSVGMLLDLGFLASNLPLVLGLAAGVLVVKGVTTTLALLPTGAGWRHAVAAALLLGQVGEFSFVLLNVGDDAGLSPAGLGEDGFQALVATTVLLMIATPGLAALGDRLLRGRPDPGDDDTDASEEVEGGWSDHVVLLGWGDDSIDLGRDLVGHDVPVVMTTLNPDGVAAGERAGITVITGDSVRGAVQVMAGVPQARLVVIAEDVPEQAARVATIARGLTDAPVMVRARGAVDLAELAEAGADHVVDPRAASRTRLFEAVRDQLDIPRVPRPTPDQVGSGRTWVDTTRLVRVPVPDDSGCEHAQDSRPVLPTASGCVECLHDEEDWVHLRVCLGCGHVGCCDSSPGRHATRHHEESGHPLMASVEPGEAWAFCFVDETTIETDEPVTPVAPVARPGASTHSRG